MITKKLNINSLPVLKFPQMVSHKSKQLQSAINSMFSSKFSLYFYGIVSCIMYTTNSFFTGSLHLFT